MTRWPCYPPITGRPSTLSASAVIANSIGFSDGFVREMIGVVGWLDVPVPR